MSEEYKPRPPLPPLTAKQIELASHITIIDGQYAGPAARQRIHIRAHLDVDIYAPVPGTPLEGAVIRSPRVRQIVEEWLAERGETLCGDTLEAIEEAA